VVIEIASTRDLNNRAQNPTRHRKESDKLDS
jgi:hypothetical protein